METFWDTLGVIAEHQVVSRNEALERARKLKLDLVEVCSATKLLVLFRIEVKNSLTFHGISL